MALFHGKERDEGLPVLSADDARRVRALVREAFAVRGREVTVHADHVRASSGAVYRLTNVATMCARARKRRWPALVARHVETVLAPRPDLRSVAPDEVLRNVYVHLEADDVPAEADVAQRPFAAGLLELLAYDMPDAIMMVSEDDTERLGGWDAVRAAGVENLRREPLESVRRMGDESGAHFTFVEGESVHTASHAVLLPELAGTTDADTAGCSRCRAGTSSSGTSCATRRSWWRSA